MSRLRKPCQAARVGPINLAPKRLPPRLLGQWLKLQPFCGLPRQPEDITGNDWVSKVKGRTGILMFDGYWTRDGEAGRPPTGGHIDLWNGEKLTGVGTGFRVGWNIVIPGIWSDFRNSKTILFFPIK